MKRHAFNSAHSLFQSLAKSLALFALFTFISPSGPGRGLGLGFGFGAGLIDLSQAQAQEKPEAAGTGAAATQTNIPDKVGKKYYISDLQRITFRTGPGIENKIISMLSTRDRVTLVEGGETWSKVQDVQGREGWVLTRFLTQRPPAHLVVGGLKNKFDKTQGRYQQLLKDSRNTMQVLKETTAQLNEVKAAHQKTLREFEDLKQGASEYLILKSQHQKLKSDFATLQDKSTNLETKLLHKYIIWFLSGAGVLLLGYVLGIVTKRKSNYSTGLKF